MTSDQKKELEHLARDHASENYEEYVFPGSKHKNGDWLKREESYLAGAKEGIRMERERTLPLITKLAAFAKDEFWNSAYDGSGTVTTLSIAEFDKKIDAIVAQYSGEEK